MKYVLFCLSVVSDGIYVAVFIFLRRGRLSIFIRRSLRLVALGVIGSLESVWS